MKDSIVGIGGILITKDELGESIIISIGKQNTLYSYRKNGSFGYKVQVQDGVEYFTKRFLVEYSCGGSWNLFLNGKKIK